MGGVELVVGRGKGAGGASGRTAAGDPPLLGDTTPLGGVTKNGAIDATSKSAVRCEA